MRVSKLVAGCVLGVVLLCADCGKFEEFAEAPEVDRAVKGGVHGAGCTRGRFGVYRGAV